MPKPVKLWNVKNNNPDHFQNPFPLSSLNGTNGFEINGMKAFGIGVSISGAGDINADGFDDIIISGSDLKLTDSAYVVFGAEKFRLPINLEPGGFNGFTLVGAKQNSFTGLPVVGVSDVNGDAIDDIGIGASGLGSTYIVFGSKKGFADTFFLSGLNGTNGFEIRGNWEEFKTGRDYVSGVGDVNGDGYSDIGIGAEDASGKRWLYIGASYIIFGSNHGFPNALLLSNLNGTNGFKIDGSNGGDHIGSSISGADVNGDGLSDIIIGAYGVRVGSKKHVGACYIVYGTKNGFPNPLLSSSLNGVSGFEILGINEGDSTGLSVTGLSDVNGDGISDFGISAPKASPMGNKFAGASYIVYGNKNGFPNPLSLADLNGVNGIIINGINAGEQFGNSIRSAGDVNGDGFSDIIIGTVPGLSSMIGSSYLIFGAKKLPSPFPLANLNGLNGIRIEGINVGDLSGSSVSGIGDINRDGVADFAVGAPGGGSPSRNPEGGEVSVVFGRNQNRVVTEKILVNSDKKIPDIHEVKNVNSIHISTDDNFISAETTQISGVINSKSSLANAPYAFLKNIINAFLDRMCASIGAYAAEVAKECPSYFPPDNLNYWSENTNGTMFSVSNPVTVYNTTLIAASQNLSLLNN